MADDARARIPIDEAGRAAAMAAFDIGALADDPGLAAITGFAARLCDAPIGLVSIVEEQRQCFLVRHGLDATETPRSSSFCAHTMLGDRVMEVPDARADPRFADNPLVTGPPNIVFYAGAPLVSADGVPLGALCVIDHSPRAGLDALQREGLAVLAASVVRRLEERRATLAESAEREERQRQNQLIADALPQIVWSARPDGYSDYFSARWYEFTGMPPGATDGGNWSMPLHPDDVAGAEAAWSHALATGSPYETEYRIRSAEGHYRWTLVRALPVRDGEGRLLRWIGTCTDIHEQKLAQHEREVISQELAHRIKNIFSVIAGLVAFAARRNPGFADVAADLRARIMALGRAHDFVRPYNSRARTPGKAQESLHGLLAELFEPYRGADAPRVLVDGQDVAIDDRSATPLALLFHELATNSAKYGALSVADGTVALHIAKNEGSISLVWRERGGPPVKAPDAGGGFGSQLIELSVVRQLGGSFEYDWRSEGLVATIRIPASAFSRPRD